MCKFFSKMKEYIKPAVVAVVAVWVMFLILDVANQTGIFLYPYTYFTKGSNAANS